MAERNLKYPGSAELSDEIARRYALGPLRGWQDLGGSWTTNLRLDLDDGARVARIHNGWMSPERLTGLQSVRRAMATAGIPTVVPFADPSGASIVTLSNGRLAELEPLVHWNRRMNTPDLLRTGFAMLGRIHDVLRTRTWPHALRTVPHANHVHSSEAAALTSDGAERIRRWQDPALERFADDVVSHVDAVTAAEAELADGQVDQLVHGDFWDNNVLFADDRLTAVIDFEFMAARWRIDDLALAIFFFFLEPHRGLPDDQDRQLVRDLVDRYDSASTLPLSPHERLALPLAIARQPAWSVGRWVRILDDDGAREHARNAAAEFPVASKVLADLAEWQSALA